jgi:methanogenic corrinoid protein MtbC1
MASLNIAALARTTGVAADTLRKWEQRYGVLRPTRTPGGQRRYSQADVARVQWLQARLGEGYRIGEAAALLGGGPTPSSPEEAREALLDAARRGDAAGVARITEQAFAVTGLESFLRDVVAPALERVGDEWERGAATVAHEHLLSAALRARLETVLTDARGPVRGTVVLACAPGERHELGLLSLAALLRADGWQVVYLGADTPTADAVAIATSVGADALCVSVTMAESLPLLERALADVERERLELVVGGDAVDAATAKRLGATYAAADAPAGARAMRRLARSSAAATSG